MHNYELTITSWKFMRFLLWDVNEENMTCTDRMDVTQCFRPLYLSQFTFATRFWCHKRICSRWVFSFAKITVPTFWRCRSRKTIRENSQNEERRQHVAWHETLMLGGLLPDNKLYGGYNSCVFRTSENVAGLC